MTAGFEAIGVEIENPFGNDFNDLPLDPITYDIYVASQHWLDQINR